MRPRATLFLLLSLLCPALPAAAQESLLAVPASAGGMGSTMEPGAADAPAFDGLPPVRGREDLWRVDSLYVALEPLASLTVAEALIAADSTDDAASLRAARAALALGIEGATKPEQKEWYLRGEAHALRVLARHPDDVPALYWLAATRGRRTMLESKRSIVPLAKEVFATANRILELDPDHPGAHNIVGKFNFELLILSGFERFIARHLLGGDELIERATWAEAERAQRASIAEAPYMVLFHYELARTLARQGKRAEAKHEWETAIALPVRHPPDLMWKELCRVALERQARGL